jgi:D-proline reductase (dithiol) PrdB
VVGQGIIAVRRRKTLTPQVDSYRFIQGITKRMIKSWIKLEVPRSIPWTPLPKPLSECTVSLISTAGVALKSDRPFDQEGERRNPWWGDPTHRVIPNTAMEADVQVYHLHVDPSYAERDLNCLLPISRLHDLVETGEIGRDAAHHYSIMGYILDPEVLLSETVPAIIQGLREDHVDAVVLVPA